MTGYPQGPMKSSSSHTSPLSPKSPQLKKRKMVDVGVNTSLPGCVSGRSPDLPSNPVTWSVEQVLQYIRSTDCSHYAAIFREEVIIPNVPSPNYIVANEGEKIVQSLSA